MKSLLLLALLLLPLSLLAQAIPAPPTEQQLIGLMKQAKDAGDLQMETSYTCAAAALDDKKYGRKCDKAKANLAKALAQAHADLDIGRNELQHKDCAGALRDLSKIVFGPDKETAQELIQLARVCVGQTSLEQFSQARLQEARVAYQHGDLDHAEALLKQVQTPDTVTAANQILNDIHVYRDSMRQAAALFAQGDYKGAAQKYSFAAVVQPNGPGDPQGHFHEAEAAAKADQEKTSANVPAAGVASVSSPSGAETQLAHNRSAKLSGMLALARSREKEGDMLGAVQTYNAMLQLDDKQADALAGRKRDISAMARDSAALEKSLELGVTSFYQSNYVQAEDAIRVYLQGRDKQYAGAAHFFLGASLLSQAILSDPKDGDGIQTLRQQALGQLVLARQLRYEPVQAQISPKILAQWTQTGSQQ